MNDHQPLDTSSVYAFIKSYLTVSKIVAHFLIGFFLCLIGGSLVSNLIFHLVWEIYQNTEIGNKINKKIFGQDLVDRSIYETISDNILFVLGWFFCLILIKFKVINYQLDICSKIYKIISK